MSRATESQEGVSRSVIHIELFGEKPVLDGLDHYQIIFKVGVDGPSTIGGLDSLDWNGGLERWTKRLSNFWAFYI